ncbi:hypothetical protein [Nocardia sp. NBC_01377]|uniref:hypothetical protein n=1 Tax=Nocardia sp. NBC_01377 TaxID=2903595 RepID=UPI003863C73A
MSQTGPLGRHCPAGIPHDEVTELVVAAAAGGGGGRTVTVNRSRSPPTLHWSVPLP